MAPLIKQEVFVKCYYTVQLFTVTRCSKEKQGSEIKCTELNQRRSGGITSRTDQALRKNESNKIKMNQERGTGGGSGRPCHQSDPREGVPVLYLTLQSQSFYLYSTVMFGISFDGGGGLAIVFLGCCSIGSMCWNVSSLWLYLFGYLYLSVRKYCLFLLMMGNLVRGETMQWFMSQWMSLNRHLMDWALFFFFERVKDLCEQRCTLSW